ncbi:probable disease resistance protein At4g27220 [Olea europaea var. sylvestris]|uniref:probable disease resistance protein At4g27220 n=1 Tax=Olea europaea var. sylvestris TaxID=158386 RepID=UPI000C1D5635|nr:probable disease resistance protein At4g27220 [Olea europaea var. sylvestris]
MVTELFLKKLGRVELHPEVERIRKNMVKRCGGLPLVLVTLAGSMRGLTGIYEWRDALEALEESCMRQANVEDKVLLILSYSYDRLGDEKLKNCLLRCSLYPEDYCIPMVKLIENFISEELRERRSSFRAEIDQGRAILNKLERPCLLERGSTGTYVKMHDLIRCMAIKKTKGNPRYMVKAGHHLREIPDMHEWTEELDKVSLMENSMEEISCDASPTCPRLSTLILRENPLKSIPDCFFKQMCGLCALDLCGTKIQKLPNSISDLENLRTLVLKDCYELELVPSLEKLKELRHLDLTATSIQELPQGMDSLTKLRFLYLSCYKLKMLPTQTLRRLSKLQLLSLPFHICAPIEEVEALKQLEVFKGRLNSVCDISRLLKSRQSDKQLSSYRLFLNSEESCKVHVASNRLHCKLVHFEAESLVESSSPKDENLLLRDIEKLIFMNSFLGSSLLDEFPILNSARDLKFCIIAKEDKIECIMRSSSAKEELSSGAPFESLQSLSPENLPNFFGLFKWEAVAPLPHGTFSWLDELMIQRGDKIKRLFPHSPAQNFHKLQHLTVYNCVQMEEIIEDDKNEGRNSSSSADLTLPSLKSLCLGNMPQMKSICMGMICCDSIQAIYLGGIKKINKVPLYLPLIDGQPSPPPSLREIRIKRVDKEWWESLEWYHHKANSVLEPLLKLQQMKKISEATYQVFLQVTLKMLVTIAYQLQSELQLGQQSNERIAIVSPY